MTGKEITKLRKRIIFNITILQYKLEGLFESHSWYSMTMFKLLRWKSTATEHDISTCWRHSDHCESAVALRRDPDRFVFYGDLGHTSSHPSSHRPAFVIKRKRAWPQKASVEKDHHFRTEFIHDFHDSWHQIKTRQILTSGVFLLPFWGSQRAAPESCSNAARRSTGASLWRPVSGNIATRRRFDPTKEVICFGMIFTETFQKSHRVNLVI